MATDLSFSVAQDIDLWLRLSEVGKCEGLADILYQAKLSASGISSLRRDEQYSLAALAIACAKCRRSGNSDKEIIESYSPLEQVTRKESAYKEKAAFYYFVASCLRKIRSSSAVSYYVQSVKHYLYYCLHLLSQVRQKGTV